MDILITANSPGEVASWLRPMVAAFQGLDPQVDIRVCLAPCAFATGAEEAVVRSIPGVRAVYRPKETVAWALWGRRPADPTLPTPGTGPGLVLFLGGDLFYAVLLGRRTRWPVAAYTEGRVAWQGQIQQFFLPDEGARDRAVASGADPSRLLVTGDLMLDGLTLRWPRPEARSRLGLGDGGGPVVGFFPGSRRHEVRHALPGFLQAAGHIAAQMPGVRFAFALSPFVTPGVLLEALGGTGLYSPPGEKLVDALFPGGGEGPDGYPWSPEHRAVWLEYVPGEPDPAGAPPRRRKAGSAKGYPGDGAAARIPSSRAAAAAKGGAPAVRALLVRGAPFDVAVASDVVLTIPGSNTAELAGLGVPMVVAIPLERLQDIPLEGLPGLVAGVPVAGPAIKRRAIQRLIRKTPFASWPNRKAGRMVVPELAKEGLTPAEVAEAAIQWIRDGEGRRRMSEELRRIMGAPGAARKIAAACLALAGKGPS